ncbi:MAG TPA: TIGR00270 family protein [Thermoplasmata archaeon]|nr:TIGR00270 family protein [Thermoplasmata archaeon]HIH98327.1 TIGR00270 family protein [Thermoplasmata archaeon]
MECELCGKKEPSLKHVLIEDTSMWVCESCSRFGTPITERGKTAKIGTLSALGHDASLIEEEEDFFPGWGEKIKKGREQRNLTREELGARVEEPTTSIAKYENEQLYPTDKAVAALEKELKISLKEEVPKASATSKVQSNITLGDVLTKKKKQ